MCLCVCVLRSFDKFGIFVVFTNILSELLLGYGQIFNSKTNSHFHWNFDFKLLLSFSSRFIASQFELRLHSNSPNLDTSDIQCFGRGLYVPWQRSNSSSDLYQLNLTHGRRSFRCALDCWTCSNENRCIMQMNSTHSDLKIKTGHNFPVLINVFGTKSWIHLQSFLDVLIFSKVFHFFENRWNLVGYTKSCDTNSEKPFMGNCETHVLQVTPWKCKITWLNAIHQCVSQYVKQFAGAHKVVFLKRTNLPRTWWRFDCLCWCVNMLFSHQS